MRAKEMRGRLGSAWFVVLVAVKRCLLRQAGQFSLGLVTAVRGELWQAKRTNARTVTVRPVGAGIAVVGSVCNGLVSVWLV